MLWLVNLYLVKIYLIRNIFNQIKVMVIKNSSKSNCPPDVRPIAVGEVLRRLTSKCVCHLIKHKAAEFFHPFQFGVACSWGAEKNTP